MSKPEEWFRVIDFKPLNFSDRPKWSFDHFQEEIVYSEDIDQAYQDFLGLISNT